MVEIAIKRVGLDLAGVAAANAVLTLTGHPGKSLNIEELVYILQIGHI